MLLDQKEQFIIWSLYFISAQTKSRSVFNADRFNTPILFNWKEKKRIPETTPDPLHMGISRNSKYKGQF